jgi:hypothetical protein
MANVLSGNDPSYTLNPKIRTRERSIVFSNNQFMDSFGRTFLDMSEFSVKCERSSSTIIVIDPYEEVKIPAFKNVIFTCFEGSVAHMNDEQIRSKQTLHFDVKVGVKDPKDGSKIVHLNVWIAFPPSSEDGEGEDNVRNSQSSLVSFERYLSKSGKYVGDAEDVTFEHLHTQVKFNIHYEYDEMSNEYELKISDVRVGGKFSGGGNVDTECNVTKKSRVFMLLPNMDYPIDGVEYVRFLYSRETWDKLCDNGAVLRKYTLLGSEEDVHLEHDMFQSKFDVAGFRGISIVVEKSEETIEVQEVSVEKIYKTHDESFDCSLTCGNLREHDVYHSFGFIRPQGNSVSFRNITRKKIDLQVLSYE